MATLVLRALSGSATLFDAVLDRIGFCMDFSRRLYVVLYLLGARTADRNLLRHHQIMLLFLLLLLLLIPRAVLVTTLSSIVSARAIVGQVIRQSRILIIGPTS